MIEQAVVPFAECAEGRQITVVATTSSAGTREGRERVSQVRAHAVARLVAARLGVPLEELTVVGAGYCEVPGLPVECTPDRTPAGELALAEAQANRRAVISIQ